MLRVYKCGTALRSLIPRAVVHSSLAAPGGCRRSPGKDMPAIPVPTAQTGCVCVTGGSLGAGMVAPDCWNSQGAPVRGADELPDPKVPISLGISQLWLQLETTGCCPVTPAVLQPLPGTLFQHCALALILQHARSQIGLACAVRAKYCYYSSHSL